MVKTSPPSVWISYESQSSRSEHRPAMSHSKSFDGSSSPRRNRVQQACIACRRRKIKCTGEVSCCDHCALRNQPCRYEAVSEQEKLKAQSYKSKLVRRRRQACVLWDVLPVQAVHSQQRDASIMSSPTSMMGSMSMQSVSTPTTPGSDGNYVLSSPFGESLSFQDYLDRQQPRTHVTHASAFDSPQSYHRMAHTSYSESTANPFFQSTAANLFSSMSPSPSPATQQQHFGMPTPPLSSEPYTRAFEPLTASTTPNFLSSPATSVCSTSAVLLSPKVDFADQHTFSLPQHAVQYTSTGLGLGDMQSLVPSTSSLPSVLAPLAVSENRFFSAEALKVVPSDADFFATSYCDYTPGLFSAAQYSALEETNAFRPYVKCNP